MFEIFCTQTQLSFSIWFLSIEAVRSFTCVLWSAEKSG